MKKIFYISIYLICQATSYPQQVDISVNHLAVNRIYLATLRGEEVTQIDSIVSGENGIFRFTFDARQHHKGFYRLLFDKNKWMDIVNTGEDIVISTDANNILDSLQVIASEGNRLLYSFVKLNKQYKAKTELLQLVLARYPKDDGYAVITETKLTQLQKEYLDFVNLTSQKNPGSFVARYIKSAQLPVIIGEAQPEKQLAFLKAHALDNVDFNNDELINSDLFSNKSIEYLTYYRNPQLPKELLEKEFMVAVDTILNKARVNQLVYKHVVEYLLDGFKKFGFDAIIDYIIENYVMKDDICIDEKLETALERRMEQAKYLKIGNTVPNIVSRDLSGKPVELAMIDAERILILFYATWCPHCSALLPQIHDLYKNQQGKRTEVFAVSIDTGKTEWQNFVGMNGLTWINVSDLKGWSGIAVREYFIYATPTMFLLGRDHTILGKPGTIGDLQGVFK